MTRATKPCDLFSGTDCSKLAVLILFSPALEETVQEELIRDASDTLDIAFEVGKGSYELEEYIPIGWGLQSAVPWKWVELWDYPAA